MEKERFDAVAFHMIAAAQATEEMRRDYLDVHGMPPTLMTKVNYFRSVTQRNLFFDPDFELEQAYIDFGKVEFRDLASGESFLLKSVGALAVERWALATDQGAFFAAEPFLRVSPVSALVYTFDDSCLGLSIAQMTAKRDGGKLFVKGDATHLGDWPLAIVGVGSEEVASFDQADRDVFGDVGALNQVGMEVGGPL